MGEIDEVIFSNTLRFFEIAEISFTKALKFSKRRNLELKKNPINHDAIVKFGELVHKESITSVIFCTMTLESFINNYGIQYKSKSFFNENLDSLKLLSKFVVIPKLFGKKEMDTDKQEFEDLKWLIKLRNDLTHSKVSKKNIRELTLENPLSQNLIILEDHAEKAIQTVKSVISIIDPGMLISPTSVFVPDLQK